MVFVLEGNVFFWGGGGRIKDNGRDRYKNYPVGNIGGK